MMSNTRVTAARLRQLAQELPQRYTASLPHLSRARVLTGAHLDRLLAEPGTTAETTARVRRRIMTRLCGLGLVGTLQRRVGGVRAGSAGHIYTLTTAGHTFLALLGGQQPPPRIRHTRAPGTLFLAHALTISGIYVDLICASRDQGFSVAGFVTEPVSWWPLDNGTFLRPDAYTILATATHRDCWWLEIDQGSESLPRLRTKCGAYIDFATYNGAGPDGVLPRVLFTAPTPQRADAIGTAITATPAHDTELISVTTHHQAAHHMATELHTP